MTAIQMPGAIVSVEWLAAHLGQPGLVVLDASMQPVRAGGVAQGSDAALQIPGAQVFDFDKKICDRTSPLPHMMPTPELFEQEARALGVSQGSAVVIYDRIGVYSSPRAWWMFKAMGHDQVAVLDGGLPAWIAAGQPCQSASGQPTAPGDFVARPRPALFCDADQVAAALADERSAVLDARSEARFHGREPEPRPGLRAGHMPNALNLPFSAVQAQGRMRAAEELDAIFASKVDRQQRLIFSCGSGVTACILALAAELAGYREISVYDGSWSEWGLPSSRPVITD